MLLSFAIYDNVGAPLIAAAPSFARFVDGGGAPVTAPAIAEFGDGLYGFEVDDVDTRAFLVDAGAAASPRYQAGAAGGQRFFAFGIFDETGAPLAGATPSFTSYVDAAGAPLSPPPVVAFGGGLYGFTAAVDNVAFHLVTGASPVHYAGTITVPVGDVTPPVLTHFDPVPGTPITAFTPLAFRMTDNSGGLKRAIVVVEYPGSGVAEVAHDGTAFSANYQGTRAAIAGGFEFAGLLRVGGWPSAPTLRGYVMDPSGNEAV